jgi:hypothetical protein
MSDLDISPLEVVVVSCQLSLLIWVATRKLPRNERLLWSFAGVPMAWGLCILVIKAYDAFALQQIVVYLAVCSGIWFFTKGGTRVGCLFYWHFFLLMGYLVGFENMVLGFPQGR